MSKQTLPADWVYLEQNDGTRIGTSPLASVKENAQRAANIRQEHVYYLLDGEYTVAEPAVELVTITDMQSTEVECFYNIAEALIRFGQLNNAVRRTNAFAFEIHARRR